MFFILALICPPLAMVLCGARVRAVVAILILATAVMVFGWFAGLIVEFALILWAANVVGDARAHRTAQEFGRTVRPIPVIRLRRRLG